MQIKLQYKYIMHDIDQWTYRLAKVRVSDEAIRNEAQSSTVSTDVSFYRRKIEEAISHIRTMLKNRLANKNGSGDDQLKTDTSEWTITLTDGAYACDAQAITDLMHKYVVRSVVTEWAMTYAPDSMAAVAQEVEMLKQQILDEVYTRRYPQLSDIADTQTTCTITVSSNNASYGTVTGGGTYAVGTSLFISATPKPGYKFTKWSDNNEAAGRYIVATETATYTATFTAVSAT